MSPFRLAWLNLVRHRAATALVLVALGVTIASSGALLRTWKLAEARFGTMAQAGDMLIAAKGNNIESMLGALNLEGPYPGFIPIRLYATMVNEEWRAGNEHFRASSLVPMVFAGKLSDYRVIGTTPGFLEMPPPSPRIAITDGAWPEIHAGVVLGAEVARRKGLVVGDSVEVRSWTADVMPSHGLVPRRMEVSAILLPMHSAWDRAVLTNLVQSETLIAEGLAVAGEQTHWDSFVLHYILVHADPAGMPGLVALIDRMTVAQLVPLPETLASLRNITAMGRIAGILVALLALVLAAAALLAVMLGRFEGLSRQMAVLEAMGYRRAEMLAVLAWEGALLGGGAVLLGALVDASVFPLIQGSLAGALPDPEIGRSRIVESWPVWAAALFLLPAASVLSSLFIFRGRAMERLRSLA